jgi:hypothetical protein
MVVFGTMKTTDAFNFFLVGLAMCLGPACWPGYFAGAADGGGCGELWLVFMGTMQIILGAWAMGLRLVPQLIRSISEWEPVLLDFELVDIGSVLSESFYRGLDEGDELKVALSLQQQLRQAYA